MKLSNLFKKSRSSKNGSFSEFFLHASDKKKKKMFIEAAKQSNAEQKRLFDKTALRCE